jgi:hypothetical protein
LSELREAVGPAAEVAVNNAHGNSSALFMLLQNSVVVASPATLGTEPDISNLSSTTGFFTGTATLRPARRAL